MIPWGWLVFAVFVSAVVGFLGGVLCRAAGRE